MQLYLSQIHLFNGNLFLKTRLLIRLRSREGGKCLHRKLACARISYYVHLDMKVNTGEVLNTLRW